MEKIVNDLFRGLIVLAILAGIHGYTLLMGEEAAETSQRGPISYKKFTQQLNQKREGSHEK